MKSKSKSTIFGEVEQQFIFEKEKNHLDDERYLNICCNDEEEKTLCKIADAIKKHKQFSSLSLRDVYVT